MIAPVRGRWPHDRRYYSNHLESEKIIIEKKRQFLIDYKQCLCEHFVLHPMISRKGKYIPGNVYNNNKETFINNWQYKSFLGLYLSEDISNFTNHDISESNMICEICIRELCHNMSKNIELLK